MFSPLHHNSLHLQLLEVWRYIIENFEIRPGFNSALLNNSCIAMCMQFIQLPVMCCLQNFQLYGFKVPNAGRVLIITFTYVGLIKLLTGTFITSNT